jgi:lipoic acid synthetase
VKITRKPEWLRKKIPAAEQAVMRNLLKDLSLHTVCQQALCPNIGECFSCGQATFLILGADCTRHCRFCNIEAHHQPKPVDPDEPRRIAEATKRLNLSHLVITSPTRDDLPDGGAGQYAATVEAVRAIMPNTRLELLVPDFMGDQTALATVLTSQPAILGHNVETVPRLYHIRAGAEYQRSLSLLAASRQCAPSIPTKSGIMLGLGETDEEVRAVLNDLRDVGCSYLSIGQYLAPSRQHEPVHEYIEPERFVAYGQIARALGFEHVESGPYVRSSYHADRYQHGERND